MLGVQTLILMLGMAGVQETAEPPGQDPATFEVQVDFVSIDVEVLDRQGEPVSDLQPEDFVVREDGRRVDLDQFAWLAGRSVSLTVLLDTSATTAEQIRLSKRFVSRIAHLLDRQDEISILSFDRQDVHLELESTSSRYALLAVLDNIGVASGAGRAWLRSFFGTGARTGLAIDIGLDLAEESEKEKKAVLLISNRFRGLGPATVDHIREASVTMLTLNFPNRTDAIITMGGDRISKRQLMRESGGRPFPASEEDIGRVSREIASLLKNHYNLGYYTGVGVLDRKPRKLDIKVPGCDCKVHARRSYVAGRR